MSFTKRIRRTRLIAAGILIIGLAAMTGVAARRASADLPQLPPENLVSNFNGRCLDLNPGRAPGDHQRVNMYDCHDGTNQMWQISWWDGHAMFQNQMTYDCLVAEADFPADANGRPVMTGPCDMGNPWAQWDLVYNNGAALKNVGASKANSYGIDMLLDVNPSTNWTDGQVYLWQTNGWANQRFTERYRWERKIG
jgi:hypothetical protein